MLNGSMTGRYIRELSALPRVTLPFREDDPETDVFRRHHSTSWGYWICIGHAGVHQHHFGRLY